MGVRDKRAEIAIDSRGPRPDEVRQPPQVARPARVIDGDLARLIERAEIGTAEVLGLYESEVLDDAWDGDAVALAQAEDYFRKDDAQSRRGGEYKAWESKYPGWTAWRARVRAIRDARHPAQELKRLVIAEVRARKLAELVRDAETYLRDRHLEWGEHQKMLALARDLGLPDADVEWAYDEVMRRGNFAITRSSAPPPQRPVGHIQQIDASHQHAAARAMTAHAPGERAVSAPLDVSPQLASRPNQSNPQIPWVDSARAPLQLQFSTSPSRGRVPVVGVIVIGSLVLGGIVILLSSGEKATTEREPAARVVQPVSTPTERPRLPPSPTPVVAPARVERTASAWELGNRCYKHILGTGGLPVDLVQARAECTEALTLDPTAGLPPSVTADGLTAMLLYNMCLIECHDGRFDKARDACDRSIRIRPSSEVSKARNMLDQQQCFH